MIKSDFKDPFEDKFRIGYREDDGKHMITFAPIYHTEGFLAKEIEITLEQWQALKFHFAIGTAKNGETKLCYIL